MAHTGNTRAATSDCDCYASHFYSNIFRYMCIYIWSIYINTCVLYICCTCNSQHSALSKVAAPVAKAAASLGYWQQQQLLSGGRSAWHNLLTRLLCKASAALIKRQPELTELPQQQQQPGNEAATHSLLLCKITISHHFVAGNNLWPKAMHTSTYTHTHTQEYLSHAHIVGN